VKDWQSWQDGQSSKEDPMPDFSDKIILIAGAGRSLGRELAVGFADRGGILALNDLTPVTLDRTLEAVRTLGAQAQTHVADIASKLALQTMLNAIVDAHGRIDVLVTCTAADPRDPLLDLDEWHWRRALDINLTGPFLLMQSVARIMRAQGGGVILNVIELAGSTPAAVPGKMGLAGLTQSAAPELMAYNIRINALCDSCPAADPRPDLPPSPVKRALALCSAAAQETGEIISFSS
jgi:NAD(P)-dependent dehydrogenase (short-subunit alcohol dehydrogenase family)